MSTRLEAIDGKNWQELVAAPFAVLVLGKTGCQHCDSWAAELSEWLETDTDWANVRFGKVLLDTPGLVSLKRAHPWISELETLPVTAIFSGGEKVKTFAGSGIERMVNRLRRVVG